MMDRTPQLRAINKTKLEISKGINTAINGAKNCGIGEMFYYLHYLHFVRIITITGDVNESEKEFSAIYIRQITDAYKYIIQLIFKYSHEKLVKNQIKNPIIDSIIPLLLNKVILNINSKHETLYFLTLFENIEVFGERDQYVKINLETVIKNDRLRRFFYYAVRADREHDFQIDDIKLKDDLLKLFKNEYAPYADLFEAEFTIKLVTFINLIDYILETITTQIKNNENKFVYLENGKIDIQAYGTIINYSQSLFVSKKLLFNKFGEDSKKIIERLTFNSNEFDERQLQYNLIARQPILDFGIRLLISPELLLDSLFVNSHYSLLETGILKEEYKKRCSANFVNKISEIANKYSYTEITRELELYEGRNQIGDIDLILKNHNNHFLLVEAKNHTIPMDVYFHDFEATEKRLKYLQVEWENKVTKRFKHLQDKHLDYNIAPTFSYIIISKSPEILSHFSNYLVFTLNEFDYWLSQDDTTFEFQKVFEGLYKFDENSLTLEQMQQLQNDLNSGWRFEKE